MPRKPIEAEDRLMTPAEVMKAFRITRGTLHRWSADGRLATITTPGGQRRYSEAQVLELLARKTAP